MNIMESSNMVRWREKENLTFQMEIGIRESSSMIKLKGMELSFSRTRIILHIKDSLRIINKKDMG